MHSSNNAIDGSWNSEGIPAYVKIWLEITISYSAAI